MRPPRFLSPSVLALYSVFHLSAVAASTQDSMSVQWLDYQSVDFELVKKEIILREADPVRWAP